MKIFQWKTIMITLLSAACIGITLSGCAADDKNTIDQNVEQEILAENIQTPAPASNEIVVNETIEMPEITLSSQDLYEQFLSGNIPVTFNSNYTDNIYIEPILENGNSYTLTELGEFVSEYYLDSEDTDKTSYDYVQYAYVECPDNTDTNDMNLLVKFIGLDIYCSDDDSYAVFVITDNNGQLYVTDTYECWARSNTTAYANGTLECLGENGATNLDYTLSAIFSNGKQTTIYDTKILGSENARYIDFDIYRDIFNENICHTFEVYISAIGDEDFYQYDIPDYCSEEEKLLCETYVNRCRDEAGIHWATDEELQSAIQRQCIALGIDYCITQEPKEAVWNDLR